MTTGIIYHDFRSNNNPQPTIVLTARILQKGRRLIKAVATINAALYAGCIFLCGGCVTLGLCILTLLH